MSSALGRCAPLGLGTGHGGFDDGAFALGFLDRLGVALGQAFQAMGVRRQVRQLGLGLLPVAGGAITFVTVPPLFHFNFERRSEIYVAEAQQIWETPKQTMVAGVAAALFVHALTGGRGWGIFSPALAGLAAALVAWVITLAVLGTRNLQP